MYMCMCVCRLPQCAIAAYDAVTTVNVYPISALYSLNTHDQLAH